MSICTESAGPSTGRSFGHRIRPCPMMLTSEWGSVHQDPRGWETTICPALASTMHGFVRQARGLRTRQRCRGNRRFTWTRFRYEARAHCLCHEAVAAIPAGGATAVSCP